MNVVFSEIAKSDLTSIAAYIAQDNPKRAVSFTRELVAIGNKLGDMPYIGVARTELGDQFRMCPHGSYNIYYRALDAYVRIERVLHSARIPTADDF